MHAYAFLAKGAVAPLSGFAWPTPRGTEHGAWVDTRTAPGEALRGCRAVDLPYWLDDELWTIQLEGTLARRRDHLLMGERARLLARVDTWDDALASEFTDACARRVAHAAAAALRNDGRVEAAASLEESRHREELERAAAAAADDIRPAGLLAGYTADVCFYARDAGVAARGACVAAKMTAYALAGDEDVPEYDQRLAKERAWQATWLADRLGL